MFTLCKLSSQRQKYNSTHKLPWTHRLTLRWAQVCFLMNLTRIQTRCTLTSSGWRRNWGWNKVDVSHFNYWSLYVLILCRQTTDKHSVVTWHDQDHPIISLRAATDSPVMSSEFGQKKLIFSDSVKYNRPCRVSFACWDEFGLEMQTWGIQPLNWVAADASDGLWTVWSWEYITNITIIH